MLGVFMGPRQNLPVQPRPTADQDVLRIAYVQPLMIDPHGWAKPLPTQNQLILSLWEPLIECDPETGAPLSAAAVSWEWSEDRCTLTLKLRGDGRWCNGDLVTAEDFVRAWRRLIGLKTEHGAVLFPVKNAVAINRGELSDPAALGVEAISPDTLRIHLVEPRTSFVAELADPLLVPLHASSLTVLDECDFIPEPQKLITNGAFRLVRARPREGCRLAASPHYRDRITVMLEGVEFLRVDSAAMAKLLVAVGRADIATNPAVGADLALPTHRSVMMEEELPLLVASLNFNPARSSLRDARVRRALALAINRRAILAERENDRLVPAYGWVPSMPGRPAQAIMREDPAEARRLLAEAGYPGGRGFPVLIMPLNPRMDRYSDWQAWTDQWYRELGVKTYLCYGNAERQKERLQSGDYDVMPGGLIATVPDAGDLLSIFAHPDRFMMPSWLHEEWTRRLQAANRESGETREVLLEAYERDVLGEVPVIPTMFERRHTLLGAEVTGWYADPLGRQALKRLAIQRMEQEGVRVGGTLL